MNLLRKTVTEAIIATAIYVLFLTFRSDAGLSLDSLWTEFWPSGAIFGVLYGVISYLISRYRLRKSQSN